MNTTTPKTIDDILALNDIRQMITYLKKGRKNKLPDATKLMADWDPQKHEIITDTTKYPKIKITTSLETEEYDEKTGKPRKIPAKTKDVDPNRIALPIEQNLGYAAVIPYGTNASFQIMRNGWMELAMRTGQVKFIANEVVHKGELVKKNKFTGEYVFEEDKKESDEIIGYMAYIKLTNGFEKTVYWTVEECKAHALRYSQTYKKGYGVWKDNFDAMALKSVLKHLIVKYCPKSAELQAAIRDDQSVTNKDNVATYADNTVDDQGDQDAANASAAALAKAEEVKAQVEATKARRGKAQQDQGAEEQPPVDKETGEMLFKDGEK